MFGVLRSVALFLVFVSSTSTRVDRLSEKYTVNIFAEIQWEPFSAPIFTVNPMIDDDVISIPFFDFSFFLILCVFDECRVFIGSWICSVVWWPFGYHHPFCSLSLSLWCIYFEGVPVAEVVALREWFDSLLIWWSGSGGSSESEYQWWFAFWFGFDWNKVFLFGILWTGCFILEQKLKIFRKGPFCIHSSFWIGWRRKRRKREREKMIVIFNLNAVPLLPLLFEMLSVSIPFPLCLFVKLKTVSRCV